MKCVKNVSELSPTTGRETTLCMFVYVCNVHVCIRMHEKNDLLILLPLGTHVQYEGL
jgi:hypothetical protein